MVVGRVEPATFAATCFEVAAWYNGAGLLIERNNHGHVLLAAAADDPTACAAQRAGRQAGLAQQRQGQARALCGCGRADPGRGVSWCATARPPCS